MKYYKSYIIKLIVHLNIIISLLLTPIAPLITQIPNLAPFQFGQLLNLSKITKIINNIISTIPKQFELISDSNINTDHNIVENEYYIFLPLIVKNPPIDPIYGPDLAISVSGSSLPINPGDDIYFTITYSNLSDIQASGVYIQAFLPDLTNFNESASSPGWTQVGDTNEFRLFLDSIPPLEADQVSYVTTLNTFIPAGIDYVETRFEIQDNGLNGLDPNPNNNLNITRSFIEASPDLILLINAETPYFYPGSQQDFLITYSNNGNQGATGIELIAYLPEYTMFNPEDSTPGWVLIEDIQIKYKLVIENLSASESDIAVFSVIVNEDLPEGIDNISLFASVYDDGSNGEDPNEEDNQSEDEVPFSESPDLALNKSANFDSVYPGSILIYSLSYTNLGISEGNNVVIDEILPENTTFDPIHSDSRWDQIDNTNQFILNLGSIAHEESGTVDFAVNIDLFLPDDILEIVNSASISDDGANGLDPDLTNNEAQLSISIEDIELPPELSVTVNDGGQAVEPGGRIIYQIHFINQGDLTATNVLITANQPLYTVFDPSQSSSGWDFNDQNQQYEYIIPTLEEGGSGDCEFAVVVSSPAPTGLDYVNGFFSISDDGSHGDDPLPSNNQFSTSTIIEAAPDLSVDIDDPEVVYVKPGDNLAFIVSYANIGNQDATNIYIDAQLPVHSIFDEESSTPGWSFITEENAYRFIVETLDANNQETLIFAIAIENETSPELTQIIFHSDIADDGSNGEDHNPSNNQDQSSIPYSEAPDLSITKIGPGVVVPGISVVYSLTYSNLGFTTSNNAVITETIPQYTTFNEALSDPAWVRVGETNQYSFSLSSLSGGSGGKIAFAVTVDPVVPDGVLGISNIASISDDGLGGDDPDLSNNSVTIDSLFSTGPTNVCGSIAVDTTWTPAESPYVLTCDVTINSGVTLDILPGTIIKFNSSSRRLIVNGNLHALGSSSARIYFTSYKDDSIGGDSNGDGDSTSPAPGDWNTILINDTGTASFNYSDIRYGGYSSSYYANLYLTQNANVSLVSSAISNSYYYGIRLNNSTSGKVSHLSVVGSVIEDNNQKGIYVYTSGGGLSQVSVTESLIGNNGSTGFETNNVYGLTFNNNQITENTGYAAYLNLNGYAIPDLSSVTGSGNSKNGIALVGPIATDSTLTYLPDLVYIVPGSGWTINAGKSLIIPPGQVIKVESTSGSINVYGTLLAQGTEDATIAFTSLKDDSIGGDSNGNADATLPAKGNWAGIYVSSTGTAILTHAIIRYGGYSSGLSNALVRVVEGGSLTLTDSILEHSDQYGVYVASPYHYISGNSFYMIDSYAVYNGNTSEIVVKAEHNWWGDASGPDPFGNGYGINYRMCWDSVSGGYYICEYYVDAVPWLGKDYINSEDLIEEELPDDPNRNIAAMEPGVPYIKLVKSKQSFFYFGDETFDRIEISVDWNGSEAGSGTAGSILMTYKVGGVQKNICITNTDESGGNYTINPYNLENGFTEFNFQATNSAQGCNAGTKSKTFTIRATKFSAPEWLLKIKVAGSGIKLTVKPNYTEARIKISLPPELIRVELVGENKVPILEKIKIPDWKFALEVFIRTDRTGGYEAETSLEIIDDMKVSSKIKLGAEVYLSAKGTLEFPENWVGAEVEGEFGGGMRGEIIIKESLFSLIPTVGPVISQLPALPGLEDFLMILYVEGKVEPDVSLTTGYEAGLSDSSLTYNYLSSVGGAKITATLGLDFLKVLEVNVYAGGELETEFCLALWPVIPIWEKTEGALFAGAEFKAFSLVELNAEARFEFETNNQFLDCSTVFNSTTPNPNDPTSLSPWEVTTTGWKIEHPTYSSAPYAEFKQTPLSTQQIFEQGTQAISDTLIVSNLYKSADPALAINDNDAVMVWIHDDIELGDTQSKELLASYWNGSFWSSPTQITDNLFVDFAPQVEFLNDNSVMAVWQQIKDDSISDDTTLFPEIGQKVELVYALFDLDSQTWTAPQYITNNTALEQRSKLNVGQDGSVMLTWIENSFGQIVGDTHHPDQLKYAFWTDGSWQIGNVTDADISSLISYDSALYQSSEAVVVLSKSKNGEFTDYTGLDLYYSEWDGSAWTGVSEITNNTVYDGNPSVNYTSQGEKRLIWLQGDMLALLMDDWTLAPEPTQISRGGYLLQSFESAIDGEDNIMLLWSGVSEAGSDLFYSLYDAQANTWLVEEQLTESIAIEKQLSAGFDGSGQLMVSYALDNVAPETIERDGVYYNNVMTYQSTDLHVLHFTPDSDLTVTDLNLPYRPNPEPGETVLIRANITNVGDWSVENPSISFYDGDPTLGGTLIGTNNYSGFIAAGTSVSTEVDWEVPADSTTSHTIFAVVDPDGLINERDETNNQTSLVTLLPDLSVSSVSSYYYDQYKVIPLAVIYNNGKLNAEDVLIEFREGAVDGPVIYSEVVSLIEKESMVAVSTEIDVSTWTSGSYKYFVTIDHNDTIFEVNEDNNTDFFSIAVLPDLVIFAGDISATLDQETGGTVSITVRNWGTSDATNFEVNLYEGPDIDITQNPITTWQITSLPVDGITTLTTTIDHIPYHLFAVVDPESLIEEIDESNNISFEHLPVVFGAKVTVIGSTDPNLLDIIYSQSEFDDDTGKYETSVEAELFAVNQVIGSPQLCDISSLQDFTDLQGKVALIEKATQCDFDIQINNAFALGAVAALIYNNDEGGNLRVTMTGMPVNIPAGFLPRQDGIDLLIYSGQVVMISSWGNANVYIDPYQ